MERTQQYAQGLVWIEGLDFSNGVIEAEIAGALAPEAVRKRVGSSASLSESRRI
jgi:hypothetical protein